MRGLFNWPMSVSGSVVICVLSLPRRDLAHQPGGSDHMCGSLLTLRAFRHGGMGPVVRGGDRV